MLDGKTSQRTLEYPIDIIRRKCYVNLENSGGGIFTAEIGVKSSNSPFTFLLPVQTKCFNTWIRLQSRRKQKLRFNKSISHKQNIKTPKVIQKTKAR